MDDLVKRLRNPDDLNDQQITFACTEAADEIERLRRENDMLRREFGVVKEVTTAAEVGKQKVVFQSMPDGSTAVLETVQPTQAQIEAAARAIYDLPVNWRANKPLWQDASYQYIDEAKAALTAAAGVGEQRAEKLRLELEKIAWMDEFLDADGAKAMMNIAREAINNDS